jgi:gluconate 2-dehydrogenase gamma chain
MPSPSHVLIASPITRREALQRAAALLGVALSPSLFSSVLRAEPTSTAPGSLTAAQLAIAAGLAERILPRTDTPGALDVGVPAFIDLMHGSYLTAEEKADLEAALAYFDAAAQQTHQRGFADLKAAQQDALLTTAAASATASEHFLQIREITIVGYFTSETVGKNVLHYEPVPGVLQSCIPLSEVGNISWTYSR